jgi:RHS repeat-associated protein
VYNALGQRVEDYQSDAQGNPMTLTYPVDISGQRTGTFAQWPSQNWTGWNVYWSQVAGQRLNMGGASAYIDHADAIGSTTMETDPAGGVQWKIAYYPWGQVLAQGGIRQSVVWAGLDWQINDPSIPSATREYNDNLGRWLTPDPDNAGADVGDSQSWNMYSYAGNNPASRNDPSGEDQRICQTDDSGNKTNCTTLTDEQYGAYIEENKSTLSFAGNKIFANGTQIGTTEYIPTLNAFATGVFSSPQFQAASGTINNYIAPALAGFMIAALPPVLEGSLALPAAGLGLPRVEEPVVSPRPSPPPVLEHLSQHIQNRMAQRGWTPQEITRVYREGVPSQVPDKTAGFTPATQYVDPATGKFIVVNNATGNVVQVSGPGFRPNPPLR